MGYTFKHKRNFRLKLCRRCNRRGDRVQWRKYPNLGDTPAIIDIPDGFEPHFRKSPLTDPWEPLYSKRTDKAVIIGLRLAKPHTNGRGLVHGGLITALADNAMGYSCAQAMGWQSSLVTISLSVDFVASGQIGQWLAVETEVIKAGSTICFAQSLIKADGVVIARANGTFRVVPKKEPTA